MAAKKSEAQKEGAPQKREKKDGHAEIKALGVRLFGKYADRYSSNFEPVRKAVSESDMKILFRTYVSLIFFLSSSGFAAGFFASLILFLAVLKADFFPSILYSLAASAGVAAAVFAMGYLYPISEAGSRKRSIEANMPFAINHMSAIASSGVPPSVMFRLLTGFGDYGSLSDEAEKIVRNIEAFGLDVVTSIKEVSKRTPSPAFKDFLDGMVSVIETGGSLKSFLKAQSDKALFEYRIKREKYLEVLSTYADFYTAIMIMAPLFLIAILAIMSMIGGELMGIQITGSGDFFAGTYRLGIMDLGIYLLIPAVNIIFILFVHLTQPEL